MTYLFIEKEKRTLKKLMNKNNSVTTLPSVSIRTRTKRGFAKRGKVG
ncbi:hypothetical protein [Lactobacillus helveticus]|nr:hypothetical protein [Lactobacillus helveticus]